MSSRPEDVRVLELREHPSPASSLDSKNVTAASTTQGTNHVVAPFPSYPSAAQALLIFSDGDDIYPQELPDAMANDSVGRNHMTYEELPDNFLYDQSGMPYTQTFLPNVKRSESPVDEYERKQYVLMDNAIAEDQARKKQQPAAWWAGVLTSLKLFFMTSLFEFFSRWQWKLFFQTTQTHFLLLLAPLFESVEVVTDAYQIAKSHKTNAKLWLSLSVNILRLAGVSLAVGLIVSGAAAASASLATLAGAAFVFALGIKALFHISMAAFHLVKSFDAKLFSKAKSDHRHDAFNHGVNAVIAATMTVAIGFVMLKGALAMATVGAAVSFAGAIAGICLMVKDHIKKKNDEKALMCVTHNDVVNRETAAYGYKNESTVKHAAPAGKLWKSPFTGMVSCLMRRFSSTSPAAAKKKNDDYGHDPQHRAAASTSSTDLHQRNGRSYGRLNDL